MLKKLIYLLCLFLCIAATAQGLETDGLEFTIRFYDKAIYFPDSPVFVKLELYNNGTDSIRFNLASDHVFSIEFDVRTEGNNRLEPSRSYLVARASDKPVFYRDITLKPGDRFGFVEQLDEYIVTPDPGSYRVRARFYPSLYSSPTASYIESNTLTLTVNSGQAQSDPEAVIDRDTGQELVRNPLPPDEVVSYMLSARQQSNWEKFLLYIDIEELYLQDEERQERYRRLSDSERRTTLRRFRESLKRRETEDQFLTIPSSFQIQKTWYTPSEGYVIVIERFDYGSYTEVKEFTYYLRRLDTVWLIYDYEIVNLGTE